MISRRILLAGTAALAAASSSWGNLARAATIDDSLVAAAKKEGKATIYAVFDPVQAKGILDAFKAKYGIAIDNERLISAPLIDRLSAEAASGNHVADLIVTTDRTQMITGADKGWIGPVGDMPYLDLYPASDHDKSWVDIGHVPYSIVWNKDEFPDAPTGWKDLLDPKYKGRLMLIDPRNGAGPAQWHALMRQTYGDDFLRALGKQGQFVGSVVSGLQQVAAGAKGIYAPGVHIVTSSLLAKGAHLGEIFPTPTVATEYYVGLMANAPHPNVARLFVAWMLSPEGQAVVNIDSFSSLSNIPGTHPLPKLSVIDPVKAQADSKEFAQLEAVN